MALLYYHESAVLEALGNIEAAEEAILEALRISRDMHGKTSGRGALILRQVASTKLCEWPTNW